MDFIALVFSVAFYAFFTATAEAEKPVNSATCVFNTGKIRGIVRFVQAPGLQASNITTHFNVSGLPEGKHAFHIHQYGDLSNGCISTGTHYNPHSVQHGGPHSSVRHVGDLGNAVANSEGVASFSRVEPLLSFGDEYSILGRAVIIHADEDDFQPTLRKPNPLIACCVIGIAK